MASTAPARRPAAAKSTTKPAQRATRQPAPARREGRDDDPDFESLVADFRKLVSSRGLIDAHELLTLMNSAVWDDGIGDRRTSKALRKALAS